MEAPTVEKQVEQMPPLVRPPKQERQSAPKMRSYAWALSGDFNAKLDLFGDAQTDEDIDALADYAAITIKALKRSLRVRQEQDLQMP